MKYKRYKSFLKAEIIVRKNTLFLSRASNHHRLLFNSRFLYELKHKVRFSKSVREVFQF